MLLLRPEDVDAVELEGGFFHWHDKLDADMPNYVLAVCLRLKILRNVTAFMPMTFMRMDEQLTNWNLQEWFLTEIMGESSSDMEVLHIKNLYNYYHNPDLFKTETATFPVFDLKADQRTIPYVFTILINQGRAPHVFYWLFSMSSLKTRDPFYASFSTQAMTSHSFSEKFINSIENRVVYGTRKKNIYLIEASNLMGRLDLRTDRQSADSYNPVIIGTLMEHDTRSGSAVFGNKTKFPSYNPLIH